MAAAARCSRSASRWTGAATSCSPARSRDGKDALDTRWWSLVLDRQFKVETIRNGSCGDKVTTADIPRIIRALKDLDLLTDNTMVAVDGGGSAIVGRMGPERAAELSGRDSKAPRIGRGAEVGEADVDAGVDERAPWLETEQVDARERTVRGARRRGLGEVEADEVGGADGEAARSRCCSSAWRWRSVAAARARCCS